ncbi:MAG: DUF2786 domain-containing protein [Chromatiales bacterium]|nr:DUF2786 domain-containing protein [Gammaproteobacteria bacterium]
MNERIAKKVAKCLALAAGTNIPAEAEAALRQAHALMKKHGLTESDVAASQVSEMARKIGSKNSPPFWMSMLAVITARAFACEAVIHPGMGWQPTEINFIGVGHKTELAAYTFEVLLRQLKRHRKEFIATQKRCKRSTKTRRADLFCQAWLSRVAGQINDFAGNEKDRTAIEAYKEQRYKKLTDHDKPAAESKTCFDSVGQIEGHRAAKNVSLNRPVQGARNAYLGNE